ncbi:MSMEG_4193 family putative phosphomutase [Streptomyces sp. SCUT-3]|uniref:histidine phosphatase family protein n=1 Tax=Streptomyces TaxID=1883 RepID=UPI0015F8024E|nr:histidine phosphatase family protein [Streptomyces sp. SCUT-3]QMV24114.1 MSMEG_4193 family putative phosphomutase [Streptomyces sp. SCUT-3]
MPTVLLLRHGRSTANTSGVLAGCAPGVALDDRGREQAAALPARLAGLPLAAVVTSPLQRCRETVRPLLDTRPGLPLHTEERLGECRYGDWTGRKLSELADEPLWRTVQHHPSAAVFPGPDGESVREMSARAVAAVRDWNLSVEEEAGPGALYAVCTHGDVIKALVADALGMHLDLFQRISVDPCSVTAIRYTPLRPFLLRLGDTGDLTGLLPPPAAAEDPTEAGDAAVGGGAGAP